MRGCRCGGPRRPDQVPRLKSPSAALPHRGRLPVCLPHAASSSRQGLPFKLHHASSRMRCRQFSAGRVVRWAGWAAKGCRDCGCCSSPGSTVATAHACVALRCCCCWGIHSMDPAALTPAWLLPAHRGPRVEQPLRLAASLSCMGAHRWGTAWWGQSTPFRWATCISSQPQLLRLCATNPPPSCWMEAQGWTRAAAAPH